MFGDTRYWTRIYIPIIVVGFVIGQVIWVRGTIRAVQELRSRRNSRAQ
jgi:hypothetical protein